MMEKSYKILKIPKEAKLIEFQATVHKNKLITE